MAGRTPIRTRPEGSQNQESIRIAQPLRRMIYNIEKTLKDIATRIREEEPRISRPPSPNTKKAMAGGNA